MRENCWTVVLVVVHRVFYSHFIISLKKYDMVANSYLRYKCKKLSFIARTGLKYDRGTREYFKRCECNKGTFYTHVLQHFIYDREIITPVST
jgi:hypothetical protein